MCLKNRLSFRKWVAYKFHEIAMLEIKITVPVDFLVFLIVFLSDEVGEKQLIQFAAFVGSIMALIGNKQRM